MLEKLFTCKECHTPVPRIEQPKKNNRKVYKDEDGNKWNGAQCPVCFRAEKRYNYHYRKPKEKRIQELIGKIERKLKRLDPQELNAILDLVEVKCSLKRNREKPVEETYDI